MKIDMSLYIVSKLLGKDQAIETAQYMEYNGRTKDQASETLSKYSFGPAEAEFDNSNELIRVYT